MSPSTGYAIADLPTLKTITSSNRSDGYSRLVKSASAGKPDWYTYILASTLTDDGDSVIAPSDGVGRWIKGNFNSNFSGGVICNQACAIGGKVFQFYAPNPSLGLLIKPGFNINITSGSDSIRLYKWNQAPNTSLTGMTLVGSLPDTGGVISLDITPTYQWISLFAKNPSSAGAYDGCCFTVAGNICTLIGFQ